MGKVVIVGSGFVGSSIAYTIVLKNLMEQTVLIDTNMDLAEGEAMDISHGIDLFGSAKIKAGTYRECRDADIIVITAGIGRKAGQTREDLLEVNERIMDSVLENIRPYYNGCFVLVVSNPVDSLTSYAAKKGFISKNKIGGTGCLLDTSRWIYELSEYLGVDIGRIRTYAVGTHGSSQLLLWEETTVDGENIEDFCARHGIEWHERRRAELQDKVTGMGAEIIRRKGKTQFGIAAAVAYFIFYIKRPDYTRMSLGNVFKSEICQSSIVKVGNYEIIEV